MIVTLVRNNTTVQASLPDDTLVFDGRQWLSPREAKTAEFAFTQPVSGKPTNEFYGAVVSVESGYTLTPVSLNTIPNPIDGQYLVCMTGTKLFNVEVIAI